MFVINRSLLSTVSGKKSYVVENVFASTNICWAPTLPIKKYHFKTHHYQYTTCVPSFCGFISFCHSPIRSNGQKKGYSNFDFETDVASNFNVSLINNIQIFPSAL
jgi:predicted metalloprotease